MASAMILIIISDLRWPSQSVSTMQPLPVSVPFIPLYDSADYSELRCVYQPSTLHSEVQLSWKNGTGSPRRKVFLMCEPYFAAKIQQNWKVLMGWDTVEAPSMCLSSDRDWRMRRQGVRANQGLEFRLWLFDSFYDWLSCSFRSDKSNFTLSTVI